MMSCRVIKGPFKPGYCYVQFTDGVKAVVPAFGLRRKKVEQLEFNMEETGYVLAK